MVQKEVADRLVAGPGGRTVGIPSMRVAWYAEAELLGTVPPEVFVPRPRVTSALVGHDPRRPPPTDELGPDEVFPLIGTAYRQRRKMLRSTLGRQVSRRGVRVGRGRADGPPRGALGRSSGPRSRSPCGQCRT